VVGEAVALGEQAVGDGRDVDRGRAVEHRAGEAAAVERESTATCSGRASKYVYGSPFWTIASIPASRSSASVSSSTCGGWIRYWPKNVRTADQVKYHSP
jgi:hypothetical protein